MHVLPYQMVSHRYGTIPNAPNCDTSPKYEAYREWGQRWWLKHLVWDLSIYPHCVGVGEWCWSKCWDPQVLGVMTRRTWIIQVNTLPEFGDTLWDSILPWLVLPVSWDLVPKDLAIRQLQNATSHVSWWLGNHSLQPSSQMWLFFLKSQDVREDVINYLHYTCYTFWLGESYFSTIHLRIHIYIYRIP